MRFAVVSFAVAVGCGDGVSGAPDGGNDASPETSVVVDSAVDASADASSEASAYPAFPASGMPRVIDLGGAVLSAPKIVTVTWTTDTNAATFDALGDSIGASSYWTATTSEYGIGPATSGALMHVHITTPPPKTMTDNALDALVANAVGGAPASGWPASDAQTLYLVYVPEGTTLTSGGQNACGIEDGYHDETTSGSNTHIVYGVVVESCHGTQDVVEFSTETASHELVEAATDPHVQSDLAWTSFDADHWSWELWLQQQDELADACEYFDDVLYQEPSLANAFVQRSWSNAKAAAGHNPCVPLPQAAYFNVTPLALDAINVSSSSGTVATKGYSILVGKKRTIQLGLYSDAPAGQWSVDVVEGDGFTKPGNPRLTIAAKQTGGTNGDILDVDITTNSTKASGVLVTAISTANTHTRYMPFIIATE